jgi:hypothetical protein
VRAITETAPLNVMTSTTLMSDHTDSLPFASPSLAKAAGHRMHIAIRSKSNRHWWTNRSFKSRRGSLFASITIDAKKGNKTSTLPAAIDKCYPRFHAVTCIAFVRVAQKLPPLPTSWVLMSGPLCTTKELPNAGRFHRYLGPSTR